VWERRYFGKTSSEKSETPITRTAWTRITSNSELLVHADFVETRFYKEWAKPQGLIDNVFCILERSATCAAGFVVFRHERDGLVDAEAFELCNVIAPHLRRAVLIGNVIQHTKTEAKAFSDLLDRVKAGVFLVNARGTIIYANKVGRGNISAGDYLRAAGGKLCARQIEADQFLQEAFRATADGDVAIGHKRISIPLTDADGTRHVANLLPLTRRRLAEVGAPAAAGVFVHKAALELPNPPEDRFPPLESPVDSTQMRYLR
jgi:hypothetical protein